MKIILQREKVDFRKEVGNSSMNIQRGETSYSLGWQEVAVGDFMTWVPELGNPICFVIMFILPLLFTNEKGKFSADFCSLVKGHFSVFLILSFQSHRVESQPISPKLPSCQRPV